MLTKEECLKALDRIENDEYLITEDDEGYLMHIVNSYKNELMTLRHLIYEHFDNNQIDWLKKCMGEEAFNVVFSSEEEVKKWIDRVNWHVKKVDELGRELQKLKSNPPLKFEEIKVGDILWDKKEKEFVKVVYKFTNSIREKNLSLIYFGDEGAYDSRFEENTYYRKQVEE